MRKLTTLLMALMLFTWLAGVSGCDFFTAKNDSGVRIGATVEEVEKVLGPPMAVLPNFGRQQRMYKAKSGNKYMITFEDGKVVEIHS